MDILDIVMREEVLVQIQTEFKPGGTGLAIDRAALQPRD